MDVKEKEDSVEKFKNCIAKAAQKLHVLTNKRKETAALIFEKSRNLDSCFAKDVNEMREKERKKRVEIYGELEDQKQQVTSQLMLELMQICRQDNVPRYIFSIAKILDNYQGIY